LPGHRGLATAATARDANNKRLKRKTEHAE
jgi:hypothetical protein